MSEVADNVELLPINRLVEQAVDDLDRSRFDGTHLARCERPDDEAAKPGVVGSVEEHEQLMDHVGKLVVGVWLVADGTTLVAAGRWIPQQITNRCMRGRHPEMLVQSHDGRTVAQLGIDGVRVGPDHGVEERSEQSFDGDFIGKHGGRSGVHIHLCIHIQIRMSSRSVCCASWKPAD